MTYDDFWYGDVNMVRAFRQAQKIKDKRRNQELWLQGMYVYEALCDVSPILHAFAKKGTKPQVYSSEPYAITAEEVREREKREARLREERIKAQFAAFVEGLSKKMSPETPLSSKGGELNERSDKN